MDLVIPFGSRRRGNCSRLGVAGGADRFCCCKIADLPRWGTASSAVASERAARSRTVRLRTGRLHGCQNRQAWPVRSGRGRDDLPRRDRAHGPGFTGQAAQGDRGQGREAAGGTAGEGHPGADHRGDEPRSGGRHRRRGISPGSLRPHQGAHDRDPSAQGPRSGHRAPCPPFPRRVRQAVRTSPEDPRTRRRGCRARVSVARQRARAGASDGARGAAAHRADRQGRGSGAHDREGRRADRGRPRRSCRSRLCGGRDRARRGRTRAHRKGAAGLELEPGPGRRLARRLA